MIVGADIAGIPGAVLELDPVGIARWKFYVIFSVGGAARESAGDSGPLLLLAAGSAVSTAIRGRPPLDGAVGRSFSPGLGKDDCEGCTDPYLFGGGSVVVAIPVPTSRGEFGGKFGRWERLVRDLPRAGGASRVMVERYQPSKFDGPCGNLYGNEQDARDGLKPSRASEVLVPARDESGEDKSIAEFVVEITHGIASVNNELSIGRDGGVVKGGMVGRHQYAVETPNVIRG